MMIAKEVNEGFELTRMAWRVSFEEDEVGLLLTLQDLPLHNRPARRPQAILAFGGAG